MFPALLTSLLFAVSVVCAHRNAHAFGGASANLYRLGIAAILLGIWAHVWGAGVASGPVFWMFVWSGVIGFGMGDIALFQALPRLGSRLTMTIVQTLAAPMAALTEWFLIGTRLRVGEIASAAIVLVGVSIAIAPDRHGWHAFLAHRRARVAGIIAALLAMLGQAWGAVVSRMGFELAGATGCSVDGGTAAYMRSLGGMVVGITFVALCRAVPAWRGMDRRRAGAIGGPARRDWIWIWINALAGPTLGVAFYQWALQGAPSGVVLPIVATSPVVVIPLAFLFEGERPSRRSLVGGVIAVAGAVALAMARAG